MKILKKAQGMPVNVIIIAIIVLIVLVVLIAIFAGRMGGWGKDLNSVQGDITKDCSSQGGALKSPCDIGERSIMAKDTGTKYCCIA